MASKNFGYMGKEDMAELFLDGLLQHAAQMLVFADAQLHIMALSRSALVLFGKKTEEELRGAFLPQAFSSGVQKGFDDAVEALCWRALADGEECSEEQQLRFADGRTMRLALTVTAIGRGDFRGILLLAEDITGLLRARSAAAEAEHSKTRLMQSVGHEIRTPMSAIGGLTKLLGLTRLDQQQRNYVQGIAQSSSAMVNVIDDILDYARMDTQRLELNEAPYGVAELLAGATGAAGLRAAEKGLLLLVEADPNMPGELWGDSPRIRRVLASLLNNAVQYTKEGYVRLTMYTRRQQGHLQLVCEVEDSGSGLREEHKNKLFEAFARGGQTAQGGLGLGLTIARQLVHTMGGEIAVDSTPGRGSRFWFWIPQRTVGEAPLARVDRPDALNVLLVGGAQRCQSVQRMLKALGVPCAMAPAPQVAYTHCLYDDTVPAKTIRRLKKEQPQCRFVLQRNMHSTLQNEKLDEEILFTPLLVTELARLLNSRGEKQDAPQPAPAAGPVVDCTVQNTTLLVVDDNEINQMVAGEMLRAFGAEVQYAEDGEQALELCARQRYDIIFMDHVMPGLDGIEVTNHIRANPGPNRQTPIVALTANVAGNQQSFYVRAGMDDYIGKPVEFSDLSRVLGLWLPPEKLCNEAALVPENSEETME